MRQNRNVSATSERLSWCRHCGRPGEMTDEHVPPKSTGNDEAVRLVEDAFDLEGVLVDVAEWREGHVVRTLDRQCNGRASDWGYVKEYRRWHDLFMGAHTAGRATRIDPFRGDQPWSIELPYDVMPARFVRQAVGMLLAVQASPDLLAGSPQLADLIGGDRDDEDQPRAGGLTIEPMHLYLSVYSGGWSYGTAPITSLTLDTTPSALVVPPAVRTREVDVYVLALAPFVFVASTAHLANLGLDINEWATWERSRRPRRSERLLNIPTVDTMQPGLRAMLYPKDYVVR